MKMLTFLFVLLLTTLCITVDCKCVCFPTAYHVNIIALWGKTFSCSKWEKKKIASIIAEEMDNTLVSNLNKVVSSDTKVCKFPYERNQRRHRKLRIGVFEYRVSLLKGWLPFLGGARFTIYITHLSSSDFSSYKHHQQTTTNCVSLSPQSFVLDLL
mmetsp:Transcript_20532/g.29685  ORF Transcript_20532/g.29685 Transcript_20532/m.29685 type:complete len:156 (+) Transcript_20532:154-621(+)